MGNSLSTKKPEFTKMLNRDKKDVTNVGKIVMRLIKVIKDIFLKKIGRRDHQWENPPAPLY